MVAYNRDIPDGPNNPSNDQPDMKVNTNSVDDILAVDHISFNTANGGNHLQVHFPLFTAPTIVDGTATQGSVTYSGAGVADPTNANLNFLNHNATFPITIFRAWAACTQAGITAPQSFNVTSVTRTGVGLYDVVLPVNVVTGTTYGVIGTAANNGISAGIWFVYTITSAVAFSIRMNSQGGTEPTSFNFMVIQL